MESILYWSIIVYFYILINLWIINSFRLLTVNLNFKFYLFFGFLFKGNLLDLISEYQQYEEASGDDDAEYEEAPRLTPRTAEGSEEGDDASAESA